MKKKNLLTYAPYVLFHYYTKLMMYLVYKSQAFLIGQIDFNAMEANKKTNIKKKN